MDEPGESAKLHALVGHAGAAEPQRRVFISYASNDAAVARKVCSALEANGIICWIAPRNVIPGTLYADGIVGAIDESSILVLVLSKEAVASAHVGRELERAASKRHPIIALRTDTAPLTRAYEYFLNQSQWIEVGAGGTSGAIAQLVEAVRLHLSPGSDATPTQEPQTPTRKAASERVWGIAVALVALAVIAAYFVADKTLFSKQGTARQEGTDTTALVSDKSIAVLPFVDMSEKKDQEYFADGMAEEIINLLSKVPDLRVPARTSSFYFKGKPTKVVDIARELGVADVLEGSVRRSGNRLRVTAQLVRADNGFHLWSQTYDRDLSDVFKVQDDIANAVVQALQITLMGGPLTRERGGTQNLEAYQLFLRSRDASLQNNKQALGAANEYLDQAIKLDPAYANAWAYKSLVVMEQAEIGVYPPKMASSALATRAACPAVKSGSRWPTFRACTYSSQG